MTKLKSCFLLTNAILHAFVSTFFIDKVAGTDECLGNSAGGYPCFDVNLEAYFPRWDIFGTTSLLLNDIWGWTDTRTKKDYALIGLSDGTAFIDVSDPENPMQVGFLEAHDSKDGNWRDIKTYNNYAYIVADVFDHGMQIFDLNQLDSVTNAPVTFQETAYFEINPQGGRIPDDFEESAADEDESMPRHRATFAYNLAINEDSGFAYLLGSGNCAGGLYFVSLSNPLNPSGVGCFSDWGFIRDAQCVTYDGPDSDYTNREICYISYSIGIGVIDVTDKSNPIVVSFVEESYFNNIKQGWLTDDKRYFLAGDRSTSGNVQVHIIDVTNLDVIGVKNTYGTSIFAQHYNIFVNNHYAFFATHRGGLRILESSSIASGVLREIGSFDTTPNSSGSGEDGVYGVYPFFRSGIIVISSVQEGLFIVRSTEISRMPSIAPSHNPSNLPSIFPSQNPSSKPSIAPSSKPSLRPTTIPSVSPSISQMPTTTTRPSGIPSGSAEPSALPTAKPTATPSMQPSSLPTSVSSMQPSSDLRFWDCFISITINPSKLLKMAKSFL